MKHTNSFNEKNREELAVFTLKDLEIVLDSGLILSKPNRIAFSGSLSPYGHIQNRSCHVSHKKGGKEAEII